MGGRPNRAETELSGGSLEIGAGAKVQRIFRVAFAAVLAVGVMGCTSG